MAVPWARIPAVAVSRHRRLEGRAGQVPAQACREKLAERDAADDYSRHRRGRPSGVSDDSAETDADDGDEAHCHGAEHDRSENPGVAEARLEVLAG